MARNMVWFWYVVVSTLHEGDGGDDKQQQQQ